MSVFESAFEVTNTSNLLVQFILEPWGNAIELKPGATVRVGFRSEHIRSINITHQDGRIVIDGWDGAESTGVWLDGILVG